MLFDSFSDRDSDLYSSIVANVTDILDSYNHVNDNDTPYEFGIRPIESTEVSDVQRAVQNVRDALARYEPRLRNVVVSRIEMENGSMVFQIVGEYKDEDRKTRKLFFKKIVDI